MCADLSQPLCQDLVLTRPRSETAPLAELEAPSAQDTRRWFTRPVLPQRLAELVTATPRAT